MSKELKWNAHLDSESGLLEITMPYCNDGEEEKVFRFVYELTCGGEKAAAFEKEVLALPKHQDDVHIFISVLRPKLWTPERPHVYQLTVKTVCENQVMNTVKKQITWKHCEMSGDVFLLNGSARFVKAMQVHPVVEKTHTEFTDNMYYRAAVRAKEAGFQAIVAEQPPVSFVELCERFGLLVLEPSELPKTAQLYAERTEGADAKKEVQIQEAKAFVDAYYTALHDVECGAFVAADFALFDAFSRPALTAKAAKAILTDGTALCVADCGQEVYAFTGAETCMGYVNGHPTGTLESAGEGVFVGQLPDTYAEYAVEVADAGGEKKRTIFKPRKKATKFVFRVETSKRNLANDRKDMVPVTAYAIDENGNVDEEYEGEVHFVPYSSAIIRGEKDFTQNVGIGADKFGNVVAVEEEGTVSEQYILPFKGGMATVLVSGTNNSRFTGITAHSELGSKTEYLDY